MIKLTMVLAILLVTAMVVTSARGVLGGTLEYLYAVIISSMALGVSIALFTEAFKLDV